MRPVVDNSEVVGIVLAIEEVLANNTMGVNGLRFLLGAAVLMIRRLRPDITFKE